jgi:hypothetical protein
MAVGQCITIVGDRPCLTRCETRLGAGRRGVGDQCRGSRLRGVVEQLRAWYVAKRPRQITFGAAPSRQPLPAVRGAHAGRQRFHRAAAAPGTTRPARPRCGRLRRASAWLCGDVEVRRTPDRSLMRGSAQRGRTGPCRAPCVGRRSPLSEGRRGLRPAAGCGAWRPHRARA